MKPDVPGSLANFTSSNAKVARNVSPVTVNVAIDKNVMTDPMRRIAVSALTLFKRRLFQLFISCSLFQTSHLVIANNSDAKTISVSLLVGDAMATKIARMERTSAIVRPSHVRITSSCVLHRALMDPPRAHPNVLTRARCAMDTRIALTELTNEMLVVSVSK